MLPALAPTLLVYRNPDCDDSAGMNLQESLGLRLLALVSSGRPLLFYVAAVPRLSAEVQLIE